MNLGVNTVIDVWIASQEGYIYRAGSEDCVRMVYFVLVLQLVILNRYIIALLFKHII
jgi:hypothetical protein